ncbi:MAG: TatD DNase family protein [Patescibacteria group bacterium]|nr:TatD DNase family protein [Patescibacteria group bacterium]
MIDTHAHLHFTEAFDDAAEALARANEAGVDTIINVGVTPEDSRTALAFAQKPEYAVQKTGVKLFATAGLHPHEAARGDAALDGIADLAEDVVAIGECGLDYYRNIATKQQQDRALRAQIEIALEYHLPLVFHVRDAWDDFFTVLRDHPKARGVIHSFTGHQSEVERALSHDGKLYFGLNGIMTFTKDEAQLEAARLIPNDRLLLETDCPYLAPVPYRGKRNEPAYVPQIADFLALLRGSPREQLAQETTQSAETLFGLEP